MSDRADMHRIVRVRQWSPRTREANLDPRFFAEAFPWLQTDLSHADRNHVWTHAVVRAYANAIAAAPVKVSTGEPGTEKPVASTHPLQRLFDRPTAIYSASTFWRLWARHVAMSGRVIVAFDPFDSREFNALKPPREMYVFDAAHFDALDAKRSVISPESLWMQRPVAWRARTPDRREYPPEQIIHYATPLGSFIQAARLSISADLGAAKFSDAWIANDLAPSGIFTMEDWLTDAEYKQFIEHKTQKFAGPTNAGKAMLLEGGVQFTATSQTNRDMQFLEGRRHWLDELCAAAGVPKSLLGMTDTVNYATHLGQLRVFWDATVLPAQLDIRDAFWSGLFARIESGKYSMVHDNTGLPAFSADLTERTTTAAAMVAMGVPLNVAARRMDLGLHDLDGGDVGLVQAALIPLTAAGASFAEVDTAAPPPTNDAAAVVAPTADVQATALNGAQIASLQAIVQSVADGLLPAASAVGMITVSFPTITVATAEAMVAPAVAFAAAQDAEVPSAPPPPNTPQAESSEADDEGSDAAGMGRGDVAGRVRSGLRHLRRRAQSRAKKKANQRAEWARFYASVVAPSERAFAKKFNAILYRQRREMVAQFDAIAKGRDLASRAFSAADINKIGLDKRRWSKEMDRLLRATYEKAIKQAIAKGGLGVIPIGDPRLVAIINTRVGNKLVDVTQTTINAVRNTLRAQLNSGATLSDIRRALTQNPAFSRDRARVVAITEMNGSVQAARAEQFAEFSVDRVAWVSAGDNKVRESHARAEQDGPRKRGEAFSNGLVRPHDEAGSPEEVIGCRCGLMAADE